MKATDLENADSRTFWAGVEEGRLLLQRCSRCGHVQFPPRHLCARCWDENLDVVESGGRGVVESFTLVARAPTPAFRDKVPYVVAAVLIEEGPRLLTNIVGEDAAEVAVDDPVEVVFERDAAGRTLPQFRRRRP